MKKELTLRLDDRIIERARKYARHRKISLSKMIEAYLDRLTSKKEEDKKTAITPLVESLSGVIELPDDYDYKKERAD